LVKTNTEEKMRIIITGGTGLIGRPLSQALVNEGHEVIVLSRQPEKVKNAPAGVKVQKWDGKSAAEWGQLADGAGAIVNLAGAGIADERWSAARKQLIRQSRIDAGKAVMEAIAAANTRPSVLIQASAVGYYGAQSGDAQLAESASPGNDFLSKLCFDWEASTAPVSKFGVRRAVIRTGVVLSNEGGAFPQTGDALQVLSPAGRWAAASSGIPGFTSTTRCAPSNFSSPTTKASGAFNLTAPNPVTNKEFGQIVGEVMGRPASCPRLASP
jgi:uncharacterized protein (TIGR01777 family)